MFLSDPAAHAASLSHVPRKLFAKTNVKYTFENSDNPFANFDKYLEAPHATKGNVTHLEFNPVQPDQVMINQGLHIQVVDMSASHVYEEKGALIQRLLESNHVSFSERLKKQQEWIQLKPVQFGKSKNYKAPMQAQYSASFRPNDGSLVIAGSEEGKLRVYKTMEMSKAMDSVVIDESSRTSNIRLPMREFQAHPAAIHCTRFSPTEAQHAISCSDDHTVQLFDVLAAQSLWKPQGKVHTDYVRSGCFDEAGFVFYSGSYDHTCKMHDRRSQDSLFTVTHGAPVEFLLRHPAAPLLYSFGGNTVCVWDLLKMSSNTSNNTDSALLHSFTAHVNTITHACFGKQSNTLVTCSLDHQVKFFSTANYQLLHSMNTKYPVLSVALSENEKTILCGYASSYVQRSIRKEVLRKKHVVEHEHWTTQNYRQLVNPFVMDQVASMKPLYYDEEQKDELQRRHAASRYNLKPKITQAMQKFQYKNALNEALQDWESSNQAEDAVHAMMSLLQELQVRNELANALDDRNEQTLLPLMKFLNATIRDARYSNTLLSLVQDYVLDIYSSVMGQSKLIDKQWKKLYNQLQAELKYQQELHQVKACLDMLMIASTVKQ